MIGFENMQIMKHVLRRALIKDLIFVSKYRHYVYTKLIKIKYPRIQKLLASSKYEQNLNCNILSEFVLKIIPISYLNNDLNLLQLLVFQIKILRYHSIETSIFL
ncbi:hypothetical protein BNATCHR385 (nucleomorph) [Bigelowiella natans]|uniref:Uncharacterized protein n=1 Tax=Bigelowiella natans TaxID=227086 RepID=Q3LVX7_BIGNA|nr:hypothetical protein BNATCHR385 [Bigelowiella natans]ABA27421.1 hypothetical protein [Bigelowiella natans]